MGNPVRYGTPFLLSLNTAKVIHDILGVSRMVVKLSQTCVCYKAVASPTRHHYHLYVSYILFMTILHIFVILKVKELLDVILWNISYSQFLHGLAKASVVIWQYCIIALRLMHCIICDVLLPAPSSSCRVNSSLIFKW